MSSDSTLTPGHKPRAGKRLIGRVLSTKRQKTITVEVRRLVKDPLYGKYLYRSTNYHAHDETNQAGEGDRVEIVQSRPLSKQKRWRLVRIVERSKVAAAVELKEVELPEKKAEAAAPGPQVSAETPAAQEAPGAQGSGSGL
jgi:small subunit ribosomal protein S17